MCDQDLIHHLREEERDILLPMKRLLPLDLLFQIGERLEHARSNAPTRPHPHAPNKGVAAKIGMVCYVLIAASMSDQVRLID